MAREVRRVDILFKDPNNTFMAGDMVQGEVILDLGAEVKAKGVKLQFMGVSRVTWDEKKSYTKGTSSKVAHKNMEFHLDETCFLSGSNTFVAGRYNWPFNVRLPPYIPGTYEGQWGRVQYWCKFLLERPWKSDFDFTKYFVVIGTLDLNTEAEAKKSGEATNESMAGICCKSGPITGKLDIEKRGYVTGENIAFACKIENNSSKKLNARVILQQETTFHADKHRKNTILLKGLTRGEIAPGEEVMWEDEIKNIPAVPPSRLGGGCKNISVKYVLVLVAQPSGPGRALEVPLEVIIGTIPFRKTESGATMLTVKAAVRRASEGGDKLDLPFQRSGRSSPIPQKALATIESSD